MRDTVPGLINAISSILEHEVLPHLAADTWPASRVRSVLMVLQHAEDRLLHEADVLADTSAMIDDFLAEIPAQALPPEFAGTIAALPPARPIGDDGLHSALRQANQARQELLGRFARDVAARGGWQQAPLAELRPRFHALLRTILEREAILRTKALELLPL